MEDKRTANLGQVQRLVIEWNRLHADNDPRVLGARGESFDADREGRMNWIASHIGRAVLTSNALKFTEAMYLLDVLAGKPTKLDRGLQDDWRRLRVEDPDAYFEGMKYRGHLIFGTLFWKFQDRSLAQLTFAAKRDLRSILSRRQPAA